MTVTMMKTIKINNFQHAKNGAPFLSIKSMDEEIEGYQYRTVVEVRENGKTKELAYKIYLNHKAKLKDGRISFERNTEYGGKPWNYKKNPLERAMIGIIPISEGNGHFNRMMFHADDICKIINSAYASHELRWMTADKS